MPELVKENSRVLPPCLGLIKAQLQVIEARRKDQCYPIKGGLAELVPGRRELVCSLLAIRTWLAQLRLIKSEVQQFPECKIQASLGLSRYRKPL